LAPLRVCLIGPECTGKTTLAEQLAEHFNAPWVPEFAREYASRVARLLTFDDVEPIARGQMSLVDGAPKDGLVILDTDLISTVVYSRHYYGQCPEWIEAEARARKADLYLLTDIDVPWTPDAIRDSVAARAALHGQFAMTLGSYGANFVTIRGDWEARLAAAITQLNSLRDRPPAATRTPRR
jgi:NadR type nicotinamide-nucleotide adenylyltransferase